MYTMSICILPIDAYNCQNQPDNFGGVFLILALIIYVYYVFNPLMLTAAKSRHDNFNFGEIFQANAYLGKAFEGEMLIRNLLKTHLQIFCETFFHF